MLHQDYLGIGGVHLLNCIFDELARTLITAQEIHSKGVIKERLQYLRYIHGTNVPSQGLETKNVTGEASLSTVRGSQMLVATCSGHNDVGK